MLLIKQEQMLLLAKVPRNVFLKKLVTHLQAVAQIFFPEKCNYYKSEVFIDRMQKEIEYLLNTGFEYEHDIAAVIEYFELFGVITNNKETLAVLHRNATVANKIDALSKLRNIEHLL
jgi:hypothetical protein